MPSPNETTTRSVSGDSATTSSPDRKSNHHSSPWLVDLFCGIVAGMAYTVVAHPFDTVKVAMHSRPSDLQYRSTGDTVRHLVVGKRGFLNLFKGLSAPLVGYSLECGVNYAAFSQCRQWLERNGDTIFNFGKTKTNEGGVGVVLGAEIETVDQAHSSQQSQSNLTTRLANVALSGAAGGFLLSAIVGPTDLIKCRVQDGQYFGPREAISHIYKKGGIVGFSKGLNATLLREVPGNAIFFTTYEVAQMAFPRWETELKGGSRESTDEHSPAGSDQSHTSYWVQETAAAASCGGVAGSVFWLSMLPFDYAKTRLQIAKVGGPDDVSVFRIMNRTFQNKGIKGLYAGAWPTLLRAFPANAAQFLAWEMATQTMGSRRAVSS